MILLKWLQNDKDWLPKFINFGALLLSIGLLLMGLSSPWLTVPLIENDMIHTQDSSFTLYFKVLVILVSFLSVLGCLFWRSLKWRILVCGILVNILLILYFPVCIGHRDVEMIGDAAWLQQQHDNMTWLGGDVYRAHSERGIAWGAGVNAQDPPMRLAVYRPPAVKLELGQMNDWILWCGYGPSFTQFAGKGWFYSIAGIALLLVCTIGYRWRQNTCGARRLLRWGFVAGSLSVIFFFTGSVTPVIIASYHLKMARLQTSGGDYHSAKVSLTMAIDSMPTLSCDSGILWQLGYFDAQLGNDSQEVILYRMHEYETLGYYHRARNELEFMSLKVERLSPQVRRECVRQQLRVAINEINSNREKRAQERLQYILEKYPNSLQAVFHSQLIAMKRGDLLRVREMHKRLLLIYSGVKSKNKRGVISVSYLMLAQSELDAGNVSLAADARRLSKGL